MDPNALDNSFYGDMLDRNFQWRSEASDAREPLWQWYVLKPDAVRAGLTRKVHSSSGRIRA